MLRARKGPEGSSSGSEIVLGARLLRTGIINPNWRGKSSEFEGWKDFGEAGSGLRAGVNLRVKQGQERRIDRVCGQLAGGGERDFKTRNINPVALPALLAGNSGNEPLRDTAVFSFDAARLCLGGRVFTRRRSRLSPVHRGRRFLVLQDLQGCNGPDVVTAGVPKARELPGERPCSSQNPNGRSFSSEHAEAWTPNNGSERSDFPHLRVSELGLNTPIFEFLELPCDLERYEAWRQGKPRNL